MSSVLRNFANVIWSLLGPDQFRPLGPADVLFISSDSSRATLTPQGLRFDRFCDTLALLLADRGYRSIHLATPPSSGNRLETFSQLHHVNRRFFLAFLMDWLRIKSDGISHLTRLSKTILLESRARLVIGVEIFGAMRIAARDLGVPCVEVLHAEGYVSPPMAALTTSLLFPPGYVGRHKAILPTHVVCFDETSQRTISAGIRTEDLTVISSSNFWTDQFAPNPRNVAKASSFPWPTDTGRGSAQRFPPPVIVVTLGWGYGGEIKSLDGKLKDGLLPNSLLETISILGTTVSWRVRLHQVQLTSRNRLYARQRRMLEAKLGVFKNVDIRSVQTEPLPAIFLGATHHITLSSTACYEASHFGVPSLVLDQPIDGKFADLYSTGMLEFADDTPISVTHWIQNVQVPAAAVPLVNRRAESIVSSIEKLLTS